MFKRISLLGALLVCFCTSHNAAEIKYPIAAIPDSLKANAKAVIRNYNQEFEIVNIGKGVETVSYAITILNENGLDYATFMVGYSEKMERVHSIRGSIYDASGKKIENLSQDKVFDQSGISSSYTLFDDSRIKIFEPKTMDYPFTVEYSYIMEQDGLLFLPTWQPVDDYNVAVESSSFKLIYPNNLTIRFLEKNISGEPVIEKTGTVTSHKWQVQNLTAYNEQPFSGPLSEFSPVLIAASNDFEIGGFKGDLSSWENFGKWSNDLYKEKDILPEETKKLVLDLVKSCASDYEKAKLVYEYMQQKTRYVNVSVGIGGWQPIDAETVNRLGYGDCKALSNYTKSLLEAVGVKAYYARIMAGANTEETDAAFPVNHFNHAIVCLPFEKDTLWLECTSQHVPFGYMGTFTDDRNALVITENGGKLIHTRIYSAAENQRKRNASFQLDPSGNITLNTVTSYRGVLYDDKIGVLLAGNEDKKKMIMEEVDLSGALLEKFNYEEIREEVPAIIETLTFKVPRYATISGPRMIGPVVPIDRQQIVPKKVGIRKSDVVIKRANVAIDSITITIPDGYQIESVPAEIKAESRFGVYTLQPVARENKIVCVRTLKMNKGQFPPSTYNELIDFYKKIASADNAKFSIKLKGA